MYEVKENHSYVIRDSHLCSGEFPMDQGIPPPSY